LEELQQVKKILHSSPGSDEITLRIFLNDSWKKVLIPFGVSLSEQILEKLENYLVSK